MSISSSGAEDVCVYDPAGSLLIRGDVMNNIDNKLAGPDSQYTADMAQAQQSVKPGETCATPQTITQMPKTLRQRLVSVVLVFNFLISAGCAQLSPEQHPRAEIGFIDINSDMKLRRMIVRNSRPKGVVLLLHGFPETLYAWKHIAVILARDYEVHTFDWPG